MFSASVLMFLPADVCPTSNNFRLVLLVTPQHGPRRENRSSVAYTSVEMSM
jgi:hypothetical protein